ncbi:hypothetical protein HK105_205556 [Polyrhizophydium stewartii]|uniref:Uncharacterized protein n=1 Tax=Polyrhizophydium stewartii TaxID=2732419 RepID=A0ABR4N650_9FUNG
MRKAIERILAAHGVLHEFEAAGGDGHGVWSIELHSRDGATAFGRPLVVAREGSAVRLGNYTVSTYDVEFHPLVELAAGSGAAEWTPVSVFSHYSGFKTVPGRMPLDEAQRMLDDWAAQLAGAGYDDPAQAVIVRCSERTAAAGTVGVKAKL